MGSCGGGLGQGTGGVAVSAEGCFPSHPTSGETEALAW